jgi:nuclear pore complex protein Nup205
MHIYRQHPRGISPREVEGLAAVLMLIRMVVEWDEHARIALCENPQWPPQVLLLRLVSCSIPPALKSELLLTLAAFAKTPEIAATLWQSIECAQVRGLEHVILLGVWLP